MPQAEGLKFCWWVDPTGRPRGKVHFVRRDLPLFAACNREHPFEPVPLSGGALRVQVGIYEEALEAQRLGAIACEECLAISQRKSRRRRRRRRGVGPADLSEARGRPCGVCI